MYRAEAEAPLPLWPVTLMIAAYPLWFLLGLGGFMWVALAAPMAASLIRRRDLQAPRGITLWIVFLIAVVGSAFSLDDAGRAAGYALRAGYYGAATVFLLYLLNGRSSIAVPQIIRAFVTLWFATVAGGYLALVLGDVSFRSPMYYLMPGVLLQNELINTLVTPGFADLQDIIGFPVPRPKAPFPYTNSWGSMMALTTPYALMAMLDERVGISRPMLRFGLVAAVVPAVVSLNRGLWLSLGVAAVYVALRLGLDGQARQVARLAIVAMVLGLVLSFSPLGSLVASRIDSGHSDEDRMALAIAAVEGAVERPVFGWGAPRPNGNQPSVGTHGQIWMVTFSHGFVGIVGFMGALASFAWHTRRQQSAAGLWAHGVLVVAFVQSPFYLMIPHALFAVLGAVAVALRYQQELAGER